MPILPPPSYLKSNTLSATGFKLNCGSLELQLAWHFWNITLPHSQNNSSSAADSREYLPSTGTWRTAVVRKTEMNLCSFVLGGILGLKQNTNLKAACLQLVCYTNTVLLWLQC